MNSDQVQGCAMFLVGLLVVGLITLALVGTSVRIDREGRDLWEREAIQHGAATYDLETGKFIWKDQTKESP